VSNWVESGDGIWVAELPDSFFGPFNPFKTHISCNFIRYGKEYHLGDVYLEGKSMNEKLLNKEILEVLKIFYCSNEMQPTRQPDRWKGLKQAAIP
jgi:hypothetical protein